MNNRSEYNSNSFGQPPSVSPAVAAVIALMAFIIGVLLTILIYPYFPKETGGSSSKEPQIISKPSNDDSDSNQNPSASAGGCKVSNFKVRELSARRYSEGRSLAAGSQKRDLNEFFATVA